MEEQTTQNTNEQLQKIVQSGETIMSEQNVSQQAVAQIEYAGFWVRFAANFVDGLVLFVPSFILGFVSYFFQEIKIVFTFLQYILAWTYAIYMLNNRQATLGKMAVGIKVTTVDGGKPTVGKLALREILGKILDALTLCIGYIMIAFTKKKQGLHDMIAGTVVIYDPARKKRPWLVAVGIIVTLIIPTVGILAGVVLVSTSVARNKAQDASVKASISALMPSAMLYYDSKGSYAGFKPDADFKLIACSGQPIINISVDGKNIAVFAKSCQDDKKYFCDDSQGGKVIETSSDYTKSGATSCNP